MTTRRGLGKSCSDSSGTLSLQVTLIPAIGNGTTLVTESEKLSCIYCNYNCIVMCLNWNLEGFVLEERGKPEYPRKTFRSKGKNQKQTQPTYSVDAQI